MVDLILEDFESRGRKLSNGAKILLEDHLWTFSGLDGLQVKVPYPYPPWLDAIVLFNQRISNIIVIDSQAWYQKSRYLIRHYLLLVWSYNANNPLNLHKWSSSNILASLESFQPLLSKSAGTPTTILEQFFYTGCQILNFTKIQNLRYYAEIFKLGTTMFPKPITVITFTEKFTHDLTRSY